MKCPSCRNHVLQKSGKRIRLRIKGRILFDDGICKAQCYWCGDEVEMPLEIIEGTEIPQERFILAKAQPARRRRIVNLEELGTENS